MLTERGGLPGVWKGSPVEQERVRVNSAVSASCLIGGNEGTPLATDECGSRCPALHILITSLSLFKEHIKYKLLSSSVAEKSEAQRG